MAVTTGNAPHRAKNVAGGATAKPRSKSRNGCITCKLKRLKCDELKPFCMNCENKKIKCGGYATRFKWRSFNDAKDAVATPQSMASSHSNKSAATNDPAPKTSPVARQRTVSKTAFHSPPQTTFPGWPEHSRSSLIDGHRSLVSVKMEPTSSTETKPLLLKEHLELASLSVVGKSTRDIKFENELLAKGINPDTYMPGQPSPCSEPSSKRTRRSYSVQELAPPPRSLELQRSNSASNHTVSSELQDMRDHFRRSNGLESLAEAAVDEIKSRSPADTPGPFHSDAISLHPFHYKQDKSPKLSSAPTPKEWPFNGAMPTVSTVPTPGGKDSMSDIHLTPSLSALINYVFTNDDQQKGNMDPNFIKLGSLGDIPLSPLDLSIANHAFDANSPNDLGRLNVADSPQGSLVPHMGPGGQSLLLDVSDQLIRFEPPSPSIASDLSTHSLMRTAEYEQILFLYSTYTCGIMSIKAGASENPWRNIFVPLAANYSYLFNSIASMTLFHLAGNSKLGEKSAGLRSKGYFYMKKCILELASGLSKMENNSTSENQLPADIALATCLNLAVSESWDTHTSSGIAHLKGAKSMIHKVLTLIRQYITSTRKSPGEADQTSRKRLVLVSPAEWKKIEEVGEMENGSPQAPEFFIPRNLQLLFNQWIYFEVLSHMTSYSGQDDKGIDLVATITKFIQTTQNKRDADNRGSKSSERGDSPTMSDSEKLSVPSVNGQNMSFFESLDTMLNNNDYVDPLLGCAQSLFLIMGRVANLISKVWKSREKDKKLTRNSLHNISLASELKQQLMDWKPNISAQLADMTTNGGLDNSTWDLYSCVSTAEAYRYAALLYLHQAVPEVPLILSHQFAEKIFVLLALIPTSLNLYIIHIFPLLVSSCEAEPGEEREWCEARWTLLSGRIWIGNIDRAFEVVKEVWRRKDEHARKMKREVDERTYSGNVDLEDSKNISVISGLIASINSENTDEQQGITSKLHWSTVMREWGWEVLLA